MPRMSYYGGGPLRTCSQAGLAKKGRRGKDGNVWKRCAKFANTDGRVFCGEMNPETGYCNYYTNASGARAAPQRMRRIRQPGVMREPVPPPRPALADVVMAEIEPQLQRGTIRPRTARTPRTPRPRKRMANPLLEGQGVGGAVSQHMGDALRENPWIRFSSQYRRSAPRPAAMSPEEYMQRMKNEYYQGRTAAQHKAYLAGYEWA